MCDELCRLWILEFQQANLHPSVLLPHIECPSAGKWYRMCCTPIWRVLNTFLEPDGVSACPQMPPLGMRCSPKQRWTCCSVLTRPLVRQSWMEHTPTLQCCFLKQDYRLAVSKSIWQYEYHLDIYYVYMCVYIYIHDMRGFYGIAIIHKMVSIQYKPNVLN